VALCWQTIAISLHFLYPLLGKALQCVFIKLKCSMKEAACHYFNALCLGIELVFSPK